MFEKLKSIFKKEEKHEREKVSLRFDEIREFFDKRSVEREKKILSECTGLAGQVKTKFDVIAEVIKSLRNTPVPESRAKASEAVKDRFCDKSLSMIGKFEWNDSKTSSQGMEVSYDTNSKTPGGVPHYTAFEKNAQITEFIKSVNKLLADINISPKEVMHIKFFFTDYFNSIGREMNDVVKILGRMNELLESGAMHDRRRIDRLFDDVAKQDEKIKTNREVLHELDKEIRQLDTNRNEMTFLDLSELEKTRSEIADIENRLRSGSQIINSEFGGVVKILKKIFHSKKNNFIESYINSPYDTFVSDDENWIRNELLKILIEVKDGKLVLDLKSVQKIEFLLGRLDSLINLKNEHTYLKKRLAELREKEEIWQEKEERNVYSKKELRRIENRIEECREKKDEIEKAIAKVEVALNEKKDDIIDTVSKSLDIDIKIK